MAHRSHLRERVNGVAAGSSTVPTTTLNDAVRETALADDDAFRADHLINGLVVTMLVGLGLGLTPTWVAVPVLMAVAFVCGRLGGRDAGMASVSAGAIMYGYAITEPHFRWAIENDHDVVLLFVLMVASAVASEIGVRRYRHHHHSRPVGR